MLHLRGFSVSESCLSLVTGAIYHEPMVMGLVRWITLRSVYFPLISSPMKGGGQAWITFYPKSIGDLNAHMSDYITMSAGTDMRVRCAGGFLFYFTFYKLFRGLYNYGWA